MFGDDKGISIGRRKTSKWQEEERERLKSEKKLYHRDNKYSLAMAGVPIGDDKYMDEYGDKIVTGNKWNVPTYGNRTLTCNNPDAINNGGYGKCIFPDKCTQPGAINIGEYGKCIFPKKFIILYELDTEGRIIEHKEFNEKNQ